jgi:hypothetical protein
LFFLNTPSSLLPSIKRKKIGIDTCEIMAFNSPICKFDWGIQVLNKTVDIAYAKQHQKIKIPIEVFNLH